MQTITLQPNQSKVITVSARWFLMHSTTADIEFLTIGSDGIELNTGDYVDCLQTSGDVLKEAKVTNNNSEAVTFSYAFSSQKFTKNTQTLAKVSEIEKPINIGSMPAVQVEATVAAAATAGDPVTVTLAAGETKLILSANVNRHSATLVRGDTDLYNVRLGYNSAANAQIGLWFAPQATADIDAKAAVYAHNPSAETQTIIAQDTQIDTGA